MKHYRQILYKYQGWDLPIITDTMDDERGAKMSELGEWWIDCPCKEGEWRVTVGRARRDSAAYSESCPMEIGLMKGIHTSKGGGTNRSIRFGRLINVKMGSVEGKTTEESCDGVGGVSTEVVGARKGGRGGRLASP